MVRQARSNKGEIRIPIDRPHGVTRSSPADTVHPIDAVQALDDPDPSTTRPPQREQFSGSRQDKDAVYLLSWVVGNVHAMGA